MDYVNLYIKSIKIDNKSTGKDQFVDMSTFNAGDVEEIMSVFPQDVLYSEDGVLYFIINNLPFSMNVTA